MRLPCWLLPLGVAALPSRREIGPLALAEVRDPAIDALFTFYEQFIAVRVRIKEPAVFFEQNPLCFSNGPGTGLKYHVHLGWKPDLGPYGLGPSQCGGPEIGDHFDPTIACSPSSGNPFCLAVPPSSANPLAQGKYVCNKDAYRENPFTCEEGDLSGKYGNLMFNFTQAGVSALTVNLIPSIFPEPSLADLLRASGSGVFEEAAKTSFGSTGQQAAELTNGRDLIFRVNHDPRACPVSALRGRSIVLHCVDNTRIACARINYFERATPQAAQAEILGRLSLHSGRELKMQYPFLRVPEAAPESALELSEKSRPLLLSGGLNTLLAGPAKLLIKSLEI